MTELLFESRNRVASLQEFYGDNLRLPAINTRLGFNKTSVITIICDNTYANKKVE